MHAQGRGKKDAKQRAACTVLESLLVNVPADDFLPKLGPKQQQQQQQRCAAPQAVAALASSVGAQEVAKVVPVQRTIAAFGPRCKKMSCSGRHHLEALGSRSMLQTKLDKSGCHAGARQWRTSSEQPEGCTLMLPKR